MYYKTLNRFFSLIALIIFSVVFANAANKVTGLAVKDYDDYTTVIIALKSPDTFQVKMMKGGKLAVIVDDASVSGKVKGLTGSGAVEKVYTKAKGGDAYVIVELTDKASKYTGKSTKHPAQINLKIHKKSGGTTITKPDVTPDNGGIKLTDKGELNMPGVKAGCDANLDTDFPTSADEMTPDKTPTIIDTIVIDPGHGGRFTGAAGPKGIIEKHVNLGISLRLARMLRDELGIRVALTRVDERHVYMKDRTGLANAVKADLFIDIHNNGVASSKAKGTETFFLSTEKADWDRAASIAENEEFYVENPDLGKSDNNLSMILAAMAQNEYLEESKELAHYIQENLVADMGTRDRGVKQMPLYVLVYADMPAVLLEEGFLTNPKEEEMLRDPKSQEKIARAIFNGIKGYKEEYESKVNR
ncbi:MAG: N-acetylmuramoyl-L-alanine amidase [bacterium]|nr:N-acetylmuramoyl-L-alanine amidase [bacterium]